MQQLTQEEIDALSPGIRGAVLWLRENGFETTDSGDGTNFEAGMECAHPLPMIACVTRRMYLLDDADKLDALLRSRGIPTRAGGVGLSAPSDCVHVEASYSPADGVCMIIVCEFGARGYLASIA